MTLHGHIRGNEIYKKKNKPWKVKKTGEKLTPKLLATLPCIRCGQPPTADGHDACCANTPGVANMCCGHGVERAYIQFENGLPNQERE